VNLGGFKGSRGGDKSIGGNFFRGLAVFLKSRMIHGFYIHILYFPYNFVLAYEEFCVAIHQTFASIPFIFGALCWDAQCDYSKRVHNLITA
jgi:hypothetical protein